MHRLKPKVVYEPDKYVKTGFLPSCLEMAAGLFKSRELIWRLFLRDFNAQYRQTALGVLWAVLNPAITVAIFIFLRRSGVFSVSQTTIPYPVFALMGVSFYGVFASGLRTSANSIIGAGPMVVKINFPKISLVFAGMGQVIVELSVRLVLIAALLCAYGVVPHWRALSLPFVLIPLFLFTLGIGFLVALLAGVFRDIVHLVPFLTTLLLFLVPALYPCPRSGALAAVNKWNPLSHFIVACRDLITSGSLSNPEGYFTASIVSICVFLVSWRIFFLSETRIAERV